MTTDIKDDFDFKMNGDEVVNLKEGLSVYSAKRLNNKNFLIYCKSSNKIIPNIRTEHIVERSINEGYWKVLV